VAVSATAIFLLAPLLLALVLLIRLDSPGPAIFRQQRVGRGGKLFTCLKFRSMYHNCDDAFHRDAIRKFWAGERLSDDPDSPYKQTEDPRITPVGRFLRRTSLDELPQLINVLTGEMSIVGPRPAIPYELENYEEWHHYRHEVKPGITGLWQVFGRGTVTVDDMMKLDVEYVRSWNIRTDLKLIFLTIPVVANGR
jgi:lipopolysaccharide/colanic/teichoic acid biosynthesis glycosyltransferase